MFWTIVLVGAVFALTSWQLTLLAFTPIPIIVAGSIRYQRRLEPLYARVRDRVSDLSATLVNNLGGITRIKAFTGEAREWAGVRRVSDHYRQANAGAIKRSSAFIPLVRMAILAGFTCTLLVGGALVLDGTLEVGIYSVLLFMTQRRLWPLITLGETLDLYQRGMASTRRILDLLAVGPAMIAGTGALPDPIRGEVRLEQVRFGYRATAPTCSTASSSSCPPAPPMPSWARRARQVHPRAAAVALRRPEVGEGAGGRPRRPHPVVRLAALLHRLREPGRVPLPGHRTREHRLRPARGQRRRHRGRHLRGRAGPEALGRPAPAAVHRPGHPGGSGRARARRGNLGGRQRGGHPALPGSGDRRPHRHRHRHRLSAVRHVDRISVLEDGASPRRAPTRSSPTAVASTPPCGGCRPARRWEHPPSRSARPGHRPRGRRRGHAAPRPGPLGRPPPPVRTLRCAPLRLPTAHLRPPPHGRVAPRGARRRR